MATIRELFHKIGNWHNKITVGAGVGRESLKRIHPHDLTKKQCKKINHTLIKRFSELEKHALGANEALNRLKGVIYKLINPDTGRRKNNRRKK